ncbi:MAG: hypothetical protein WC637_08485 [Victivallales bacterium]|jgi:hypothetical protein
MLFKKDIPFIKKGLEVSQISFSGGRTAASIANHGGITHINYYGAQRFRDVIFYKGDQISAWAQLFRIVADIDGNSHTLDFRKTRIYPFGYSSRCKIGEIELEHGMWLLNDAIVFSLKIRRNPAGSKIVFKLIHADVCVRVDKPTRAWEDFSYDSKNGIAVASACDSYPEETIRQEKAKAHLTLAQRGTAFNPEPAQAETLIGITTDHGLHFRDTTERFRKYYFSTDCVQDEAYMVLGFGHQEREAFLRRLETLRSSAASEVAVLLAGHKARMASQPQISIGQKTVQSLFMNVSTFLDSLKVKDLPGGMRAADSGYWIWGWDSMVYADALGLCNDSSFLIEMLDFYRKTADPELGVFHAMTLDRRPFLSMAFNAQCLYAVMLYYAYVFTGDRKMLSEFLPFAQWVVGKAGDAEETGTGLIKGVSLYPDHPEDLEQDGNDFSVFNNSIYYQALKVMAELALESGDKAAAAGYTAKARKTLAGFQRFYDSDKGYFYDSISSKDFSPRQHYPLYAILWVTPFAGDLVADNAAAIAKFMRENFPVKHGLRILPKWDSRYMYDGSQLGMYMPVIENFHREMMKSEHDSESLTAMFENIEWFWEQLCIPEALTCEYENHGITVDNPGRKQLFCAKAWLSMFYHVAAGINFTVDGISFSPSGSGEISIKDFSVRGREIDIEISGRGWEIGSLSLNGNPVLSPFTIPFSALEESNTVKLLRIEV